MRFMHSYRDGTLVTQRLFYAPDPRPHRHVLGWYQLIQELRQNKVNVICVFDGKDRVPAKQDEVERRRSLRMQAQAREDMPIEHQQEVLKTLKTDPHLPQKYYTSTDTSDLIEAPQIQVGTTGRLGQVSDAHVNPPTSGPLPFDGANPTQKLEEDPTDIEPELLLGETFSNNAILSGSEQDTKSAVGSQPHVDKTNADASMPKEIIDRNASEITFSTKSSLPEQLDATGADNTPSSKAEEYPKLKLDTLETTKLPSSWSGSPVRTLDLTEAESSMEDARGFSDIPGYDSVPQWTEIKRRIDSLQSESNKALASRIFDLFDHYNRTTTSGSDGTISALSAATDVQDMPIIPISRVQLKYSQEEAKIWKQLVTSSDSTTVDLARVVEMVEEFASAEVETEEKDKIVLEEEAELSITERSAKLEEQSSIMAASLARRANSPKALTYAESRLLLEAMGIPCIQSYLPYEGEALASSLVLHGLADFVGSEDTDVLMYNAPLLRNLTNRNLPLQIIPPSVEINLGLSRSAFMDAAILMGTDFVKRVGGIGPVTAWRLMHEYGSIEVMLEQEPKFRPSDVAEYLEQVKVARKIFNTIPPAPPAEDILPGHWDEQAVHDVMTRFELHSYLEDDQTIPGALAANYYDDGPESKDN
ncbi:hypothetical protein BN14_02800 [Rhizoctonia solani AG-1 IB]|uniref:XPG-I domain-containing protein n=1 Tax=Thanatephorus cucumeris (strain AG1-IB / isolate 7/3/14) TaxID=1108050 RepID=M5BYJ7_THACB|nr:hypothetical protein BN14_02800 [Rhizoctonia solani AG-1 IB]